MPIQHSHDDGLALILAISQLETLLPMQILWLPAHPSLVYLNRFTGLTKAAPIAVLER